MDIWHVGRRRWCNSATVPLLCIKRTVTLRLCICVVQEIAGTIAMITAMPTFQVWQNGVLADTLVGASLDKLNAMVSVGMGYFGLLEVGWGLP